MRLAAILLAAQGLAGCVAAELAGDAVGAAGAVAGGVISATGSVAGAAIDAAAGGDDEEE